MNLSSANCATVECSCQTAQHRKDAPLGNIHPSKLRAHVKMKKNGYRDAQSHLVPVLHLVHQRGLYNHLCSRLYSRLLTRFCNCVLPSVNSVIQPVVHTHGHLEPLRQVLSILKKLRKALSRLYRDIFLQTNTYFARFFRI